MIFSGVDMLKLGPEKGESGKGKALGAGGGTAAKCCRGGRDGEGDTAKVAWNHLPDPLLFPLQPLRRRGCQRMPVPSSASQITEF